MSNFGQLSEFGLPDDYKNIYSITNVEKFTSLSRDQKDLVQNLFKQYNEIFAKNDRDIGLAKDTNHKIDTGSHQAIDLRLFQRSRAAEAIAELEI